MCLGDGAVTEMVRNGAPAIRSEEWMRNRFVGYILFYFTLKEKFSLYLFFPLFGSESSVSARNVTLSPSPLSRLFDIPFFYNQWLVLHILPVDMGVGRSACTQRF